MNRSTIICVDNEEVILNSLGEQLKRHFGKNYDIELAQKGSEVLDLCEELTEEGIEIPVIISDQRMPEISGDKLLIKVHHHYPKTLKILLTGQADAVSVGNIVNVGALYRFLSKPWQETDLILTIKEAIHSYEQDKQITEQNKLLKKINQKLHNSLSLLQATLEATAEGILVIDNIGRVISFNQTFINLWSIPHSIATNNDKNQSLAFLLTQLKTPEIFEAILVKNRDINEQQNNQLLELNNNKIFNYSWQPQKLNGKMIGRVFSFRDITEQKQAEAIIKHQALHDPLTNVANRIYFEERLCIALNQAQQTQKMLAVMFLDLDHFKEINDTLGHGIGDKLLQRFVECLQQCVRDKDLICRLGGDEFLILLPDINHRTDVSAIAQRILTKLTVPFVIENNTLHISSSIGIAIYPDHGQDTDTLVQKADVALYYVKQQGRNNYHFFQ
ncbi:diguanylate cyclase domain-containing protein [Crocosphaera chwakensis]|uniref:Sensory box protein, GGDEF family protein, LssE n=1 Tax=Crocosphaera chwakensis CCY0110 TaxID=391612 RepID=A3IHA4_9CHRO|nr:diguanylate cyclase [Crocosphaera chwakensis]EAZ94346.1 sensory box protein, GGDEF family protein, LssE [Crocosphaera chwakensis CCY0110]